MGRLRAIMAIFRAEANGTDREYYPMGNLVFFAETKEGEKVELGRISRSALSQCPKWHIAEMEKRIKDNAISNLVIHKKKKDGRYEKCTVSRTDPKA